MGCGCHSKSYRTGQAVTRLNMAPPSTHLSEKAVSTPAKSGGCGCNGEKGSTLIHSQAAFPWPVALLGGVALGWILRRRA